MKEFLQILENEKIYSIIITIVGVIIYTLLTENNEVKNSKVLSATVILLCGFFVNILIGRPVSSLVTQTWRPIIYGVGSLSGVLICKGLISVFKNLNYGTIFNLILKWMLNNLNQLNDGIGKRTDKQTGND